MPSYLPDYEKLYECSDVYSTRPFKAGIEADFEYSCALLRGDIKPSETIEVRHMRGTHTPALAIHTGFSLLLHDSIIEAFIQNQITGWETFRIALYGKNDEIIPNYSGVSITGRCNPLDYSRSEIVYREYPGGIFPRFKGSYFKDDFWDGTDLFMDNPDTRGYTLNKYVSERVKNIFDNLKTKNLEFTNLTGTEIDVMMIAKERRPEHLR
ncbi:hypothetical protein M3194_24880 [Paenibacillus glycanilyticus]|uniref:hypothetical protein n=1 Tax=Paenibacillus glycanilyticus TaxID=126569 RepID=UPI002040D61D|nr:hypothetical protein [Paenibacillus glycanilyticus]MCM3630572.1 hypothetical protein [Paenibacillus glycanilyticus]